MDRKKIARVDPNVLERYQKIVGKPLSGAEIKQPATPSSSLPSSPQTAPSIVNKQYSSQSGSNSGLLIASIVVGVFFFAAYAFFWIKFFHLKLPFTLPF